MNIAKIRIPVISFITLNYNGLNDTIPLINSIIDNIHSVTYEIIIVDNASRVDEISILKQKFPKLKYIQNPTNLGFAAGNNLGIKEALGEYIFLINNDTFFTTDGIVHLVERIKKNPKIGVVCPKILFYDPKDYIQFAGYTPLSAVTLRNNLIGFMEYDNNQYSIAHSSPYMHGAAALVSRDAITKVGLIPENYFLYYEELDWSERIKEAGFEIWYEPLATIYHKESQSVGQNSALRTYYMTRNRLRFAKRNLHGITKYSSYFYQFFISAPVNIAKYIVSGNFGLLTSHIKGLKDFMSNKI